jgi:hypothetical protein
MPSVNGRTTSWLNWRRRQTWSAFPLSLVSVSEGSREYRPHETLTESLVVSAGTVKESPNDLGNIVLAAAGVA